MFHRQLPVSICANPRPSAVRVFLRFDSRPFAFIRGLSLREILFSLGAPPTLTKSLHEHIADRDKKDSDHGCARHAEYDRRPHNTAGSGA